MRYDEEDSRSRISKDEAALSGTAVGERLAYNDYTTIDWLHELVRPFQSPITFLVVFSQNRLLPSSSKPYSTSSKSHSNTPQVKESYRARSIHARPGLRATLISSFDSCSGWICVSIIGILMAFVAVLIDLSVATVGDWKYGYCAPSPWLSRERCCEAASETQTICEDYNLWGESYWARFGVYVAWAVLFGIVSSSVTMLSKTALPSVAPGREYGGQLQGDGTGTVGGKSLYMSAGSGIPEIKTILSGFVIPHYLDVKILVLKAVGAVFAVATGMSLGKEGPFIHIAACVGQLVAERFPKYRENQKKMREILSAACAAGLSAAFGAPIGGVLFAYEVGRHVSCGSSSLIPIPGN
jgi:chloride channel 3/4/5